MSRLALAKPALRPSLKARLSIAGPAGAGKTHTALEIAAILGSSTLVIDTERESALTYADEFTFEHLPWVPPFDPRELGKELVAAALNYDTVIVDSYSHFWTGEGGTLDIADSRFGGWKTARPAQNDGVAGILDAGCHVIICLRSKMEYAAEEVIKDGKKKQEIRKLGMAPQQDGTLEYELNLAIEMDIEHRMGVSKSRSAVVPVGASFAPGHAADFAKKYAEWLSAGEPWADLVTQAEIDTARRSLPEAQRKELWRRWQENSLPADLSLLTVTQAIAAKSLIEAITEGHVEAPSVVPS